MARPTEKEKPARPAARPGTASAARASRLLKSPIPPDSTPAAQEEWQFRATLWWCKTAYGLLSLPFVVFLLPGLGSALTHVKATGYNKNGRCVRMLTPAQRRQKRQAREAKERMQQYAQEEALGLAPLCPHVFSAEGSWAASSGGLGVGRGVGRGGGRGGGLGELVGKGGGPGQDGAQNASASSPAVPSARLSLTEASLREAECGCPSAALSPSPRPCDRGCTRSWSGTGDGEALPPRDSNAHDELDLDLDLDLDLGPSESELRRSELAQLERLREMRREETKEKARHLELDSRQALGHIGKLKTEAPPTLKAEPPPRPGSQQPMRSRQKPPRSTGQACSGRPSRQAGGQGPRRAHAGRSKAARCSGAPLPGQHPAAYVTAFCHLDTSARHSSGACAMLPTPPASTTPPVWPRRRRRQGAAPTTTWRGRGRSGARRGDRAGASLASRAAARAQGTRLWSQRPMQHAERVRVASGARVSPAVGAQPAAAAARAHPGAPSARAAAEVVAARTCHVAARASGAHPQRPRKSRRCGRRLYRCRVHRCRAHRCCCRDPQHYRRRARHSSCPRRGSA